MCDEEGISQGEDFSAGILYRNDAQRRLGGGMQHDRDGL